MVNFIVFLFPVTQPGTGPAIVNLIGGAAESVGSLPKTFSSAVLLRQ